MNFPRTPKNPRYPVTKLMAYGEGGGGRGAVAQAEKQTQYKTYMHQVLHQHQSNTTCEATPRARQAFVSAGGKFKSSQLASRARERYTGERVRPRETRGERTRTLFHVPSRNHRFPSYRRGQRRDAEAAQRQEPGGIEDIARFEGRGRVQTERRRQVHGSNFVPGRSERTAVPSQLCAATAQ